MRLGADEIHLYGRPRDQHSRIRKVARWVYRFGHCAKHAVRARFRGERARRVAVRVARSQRGSAGSEVGRDLGEPLASPGQPAVGQLGDHALGPGQLGGEDVSPVQLVEQEEPR